MTFRGRDVFDIRVPRAGISYEPLFEWMEAAHWANYRWEVFRALDGDDQARIVAHHRAHMQLEAVLAQDAQRRNS